ncbi:urokinase plasminogen activator surface receptor-like [Clarias gariepinus]|uniref:urokinase plasminogen activator surface receptor-like n=1 Tax=Clarias gariepinus TaxID=13013 RepID=UPI00234CFCFE|nr:urokinase plasminogen activator surface receptor-like [Clarias gariepinus]
MKSQVTLLLICMLFSKALSLTCQQCLPTGTSATCQPTQITCPNQCLTSTITAYSNGVKFTDYIQTCGTPDLCVSGSLNMGSVKVTTNSKCCSTDFCNTEKLPELPQQPPNGRMCYTCNNDKCLETVSCTGDEDRCISASVQQEGISVSVKGCVSASGCAASGSSSTPGIGVTNLQCCEGNLCNSAESFTLSFLPMIVPLLSSIFFY